MGQRRLKNITIVLEWMPQLAQFQPAPVATSGATASASSSSSASLSPTSTFASSAILSESQELALRTAFKMFDEDGDNLISVAQLKGLMREIGEDLSDHDLQSLVQNDLSYTDFRQFMMNRSLNRKDLHGKRYFVAVSLKEAESLRRLIHTQHPLFAQTDDPSRQVSIGLRMLNGALLDASPAYKPADDAQQSLALQSLRFINAEFFYNDLQLSLLLKALQNNPPRRRQAFFENVLRCRRRDRRRFNDTPLNSIFHLSDEQHLLSYRAKVARVRMCLKSLSLSLQDAFQKFDAHGDAYLNCTELGYALIEYLKLPLNMEDIDQLMEFANKSGNGLLSLEEFLELLREPEIVVNKDSDLLSAQDRAKVTTATNMEIDEDDDDLPSVPSSTPLLKRNISTTRLTLSPEYERLFHEEEALRVKKQEEVEREIEMAKAEKVAREIEKKQLEEQQAADWKSVQEMRKLTAMEERWTCPACTFKNESTSYHCTVCESKRPEQQERKEDIADMEDIGDGNDGPAFWNCAVCSYNNDNSAAVCEMCNAQKPKVQRAQKKIVSLWSCPTCTRLVTSDKTECDVCSSDREAIRSAAPVSEAKCHDLACLFGTSLIGKDGVPVQSSDLMGKVVGIYFSASWCAPCRAFTPQLASLYQGAVSAGLPFEIVFVSADQDVESFNEYFAKMPWKAVKFSDTDLRKKLNSQFEVQGIPTLIVVNDQGEIITKDGRAELAQGGDTFIAMWCKAEQEKQAAQGKKH